MKNLNINIISGTCAVYGLQQACLRDENQRSLYTIGDYNADNAADISRLTAFGLRKTCRQ